MSVACPTRSMAVVDGKQRPKTMQDAIEFATELMDKKINTWAEHQADNKRKTDDTARNNQNQQPNKRQNTGRAYAAGNGDRRPYGGPRPLGISRRIAQNGRTTTTGVIRLEMPRLRQRCMPWAMQGQTRTTILNNRYASILFDTGADRSFVSTAFSSQIVITPTALDHDYNVELADGRIEDFLVIESPSSNLISIVPYILITFNSQTVSLLTRMMSIALGTPRMDVSILVPSRDCYLKTFSHLRSLIVRPQTSLLA
ncbi:putative reverse transcriptase domain-containing protein [Tanacetum coccineum]